MNDEWICQEMGREFFFSLSPRYGLLPFLNFIKKFSTLVVSR